VIQRCVDGSRSFNQFLMNRCSGNDSTLKRLVYRHNLDEKKNDFIEVNQPDKEQQHYQN
jgi:hypothetical protein